jgi:hypothetical protein
MFCSTDSPIANSSHEALLIDKNAKAFFRSKRKIKYKLAIATVERIIIMTKLFILKLKKRKSRIKKAFWGPAMIKQVFQFKKLNTKGCHTWNGNNPNFTANPRKEIKIKS